MMEMPLFSAQRYYSKKRDLIAEDIAIEKGCLQDNEAAIVALMRRNLSCYDANEQILMATYRRLERLSEVYKQAGSCFYVAKSSSLSDGKPIACVGVGPLHGLPVSEKIGEVRDLVVEKGYRGWGLGGKLLYLCIAEAKKLGYERLYLESSQHMTEARRLFLRAGFRPVTDKALQKNGVDQEPGYFLMETL